MSDIRFRCPVCKGKLSVDGSGGGQNVTCPKCESRIMIPRHSTLPPRIGSTLHSGTQALEAEITRLTGELESLKKGAPADGELARLQAQIEESEVGRRKFEEEISKLRSDLEKNQSESGQVDAVREEARKERELRKRLEQEFEVTSKRLDGEVASLKNARKNREEESTRREKELQEKLAAAEVQKEVPDADEISSEIRKQLEDEFREQLEKAETGRRSSEQQAIDARKELETQQQKLTEAIASEETAGTAWREREEALGRESEKLRQRASEADHQLKEERELRQARETEFDNTLQAVKKELDSSHGAAIAELQGTIRELETARTKEQDSHQQQVKSHEDELQTLRREVEAEKGRVEKEWSERVEQLSLRNAKEIEESVASLQLTHQNQDLKREEEAKRTLEQEIGKKEETWQKNLQEQIAKAGKLFGDLESARKLLKEKDEELNRVVAGRKTHEQEIAAKDAAGKKEREDLAAREEKLSRELESVRASLAGKSDELKRGEEMRLSLEQAFKDKEAAWQKILEDQNGQKESLSREHNKGIESLSKDLESTRKALEESEQKIAREQKTHQAREDELKAKLKTLSVSGPTSVKPEAPAPERTKSPGPTKKPAAGKTPAQPREKPIGEGKSVQDLVKEEGAAQSTRQKGRSPKKPADVPAKKKPTPKQTPKRPEPAPAVSAASEMMPVRPLSGLLVLGWLSLLAGICAAVAVPHVSNLTTGAIGMALLIGVIVLIRRRTPLVFGLIALSVLMPPMLAVGVGLGYRGLFPPSNASSGGPGIFRRDGPPPKPVSPENPPRINVGDSVIVDGVEITFSGVRVGPVMVRAFIDDDVETFDDDYLIIDLTLKNTAEDRPLHLDNPWEKSRISDSYNELYVIDQQRQGLEHVEGTLGSIELEPGLAMSDMIVFEMPDDRAKDFHLLADPGFCTLRPDGMYENVSSDPLRLSFKRSDFQSRE